MAFIKLENGKTFYSYPSNSIQLKIYKNFITKNAKKNLVPEALNVAYDVLLRYEGPKNNEAKLRSGKFYDFKKGNVVVEAGAYIGYFALKASEIVGEDGKVIAIEAVPENFRVLQKNIESNNIKNIIAVNKAVWNQPKTIKFFRENNQFGSIEQEIIETEKYLEVPADRIDNVLKENKIENIDFARIQLNGSEPEGVESLGTYLNQYPIIMAAGMYEKNGVPVHEILSKQLTKLGYKTELKGESILAKY